MWNKPSQQGVLNVLLQMHTFSSSFFFHSRNKIFCLVIDAHISSNTFAESQFFFGAQTRDQEADCQNYLPNPRIRKINLKSANLLSQILLLRNIQLSEQQKYQSHQSPHEPERSLIKKILSVTVGTKILLVYYNKYTN